VAKRSGWEVVRIYEDAGIYIRCQGGQATRARYNDEGGNKLLRHDSARQLNLRQLLYLSRAVRLKPKLGFVVCPYNRLWMNPNDERRSSKSGSLASKVQMVGDDQAR
jgi:hypothetical protein